MECGLCGTLNRDLARFCGGCGAPLGRVCANCKSEIDAGLRFCDQCGTPVEGIEAAVAPAATPARERTPEAVRKTVTVLFADLGGSTGFGERTDPEVARQVLARYHALLQEAIDEHRGTVAKFMGDGMMATFGIPEVAEDDAERAVRAGIAIQDRFAHFADDVEATFGERLTARVGVNTGEVVIGAADADLVGDALNVAARLEKACRPGHVLVGDDTWRLTRGALAYESLGAVTVAGRARPVGTYEVATTERAADTVAPFVGRDPELARLVTAFDHARSERAAVLVTVVGSPGLGKTRLSRELAARVRDAGGVAFEIRCDRSGGSTFAPVADLLREAAGLEVSEADDGITHERLGALVPDDPDRSRVVEALAGVLGAAPARSVEETFWAVRRTLESLATEHPLLVVVDDIQWAEPKLLDLIDHLAEWVTGVPLLLVGLARPELRDLRPAFVESGRRVSHVVALDGLDVRATEALAAGLLGSALPRELVERLPASTDGNPLFVRELVRMLVDDGVIQRRDDGSWDLAIDADAVEVPPTIQSLLATRVERLPVDELRTLELASVVGAEFSVGALHTLGADDLALATLLERLRRKELVEPTGAYWGDDPLYRFHHVLIRDAAYRRLLKGARADLHRRVGEWTDATAKNVVGEHETTVAFHYEQAHRYRSELGMLDDETDRLGRRASELLDVAARRAFDRDDLASAGALAGRALAVLPAGDVDVRSELLLMACECLLASGAVATGAPLVDELTTVGAGDPKLSAWAGCFRAQLVALTDPEGLVEAEGAASRAAETLRGLGDGAGEAKAHQVRALLLARLGRVGEAEAVLDLALGAARAADDRRRVTAVLGAAPQAALFGPSPVARAGGRCLDVVRLLRITTASPSVEATSMRCQAVLEALRGRFDVARSMLESSRVALEELGLRHGLLETDLFAGMVELIAEDPAAAVMPLRAAYEGLGTLGVGADAGQAAALLASALLAQGETDEAELMAAESEALAGQNLKTAIAWRIAKASVLAARDAVAEGVALALEAVEIASATDLVLDHADACVVLADLRDTAGDAAGALAAREEARRLYEAKGATVPAERLAAPSDEPVTPAPPTSTPAAHDLPASEGARNSRLGIDDLVGASSVGARRTPPANRSTRAIGRWAELTAGGRFEDAARLFHPDVVRPDFSSVVSFPTLEDAEAFAGLMESAAEVGYSSLSVVPIAVRGERLHLARTTIRTRSGFETVNLYVNETDDDDLCVYSAQYDDDDLAGALADLDARYLAGEGAPDAAVLALGAQVFAALNTRDWDAYEELIDPAFVGADHRELGWPTLDRAGLVAMMRGYADLSTDFAMIPRQYFAHGRCLLAVLDVSGTTLDGTTVEWVPHLVITATDSGRMATFDIYDEGDLDAARARFDALGREATARPGERARGESGASAAAHGATPSPGPILENAATRFLARTLELARRQRWDDVGSGYGDAYVRVDRRSVTGAGTVPGRDAEVDNLRSVFALAPDIDTEVLAIRDDRLALSRLRFETDGFEIVALQITSVDGDGRCDAVVAFDDGDLDAALAELDLRSSLGGDRDELRTVLSPDPVVRLHELGHRARSRPVVENEAVRRARKFVADVNAGRDDEVEAVFGRDYVRRDHRRTVSGDSDDRDGAMASIRAARELGIRLELDEIVAVRGERLMLARGAARTEAGDELPGLDLAVLGDDGRFVFDAYYDEDDLATALRDLDALFALGEGAEHAEVLRVVGRFAVASARDDFDRMRALLTDDFVIVDHRPLGFGRGDRDYFIATSATRNEVSADGTMINRTLEVAGRSLLVVSEAQRITEDGAEYVTVMCIVFEVDASDRIRRAEYFDEDQYDRAVARLRELGGPGPRSRPAIENQASGRIALLLAFANDLDGEALRAMTWSGVAEDVVRLDRRRLVAAPPIRDRDAFAQNAAAFFEVFDTVKPEVVAVRGTRLALVRLHCGQAPDFVLRLLVVYEFDEQGDLVFEADYDDEDLAAALEELDQRYLAGEGAEHERVLQVCRAFARASDRRDFDTLVSMLAPDFVMDDRTRLGYGLGDGDYFDRSSRSRADVAPDDGVTISHLLRIEGDTLLSVAEGHLITPEGSDYVWESCVLLQVDPSDRIRRAEYFDLDRYDDAVARVHELAEPRHGTSPPPIENEATRADARAAAALARPDRTTPAELALAPDFVLVDRRSVIALPNLDAEGLAENFAAMRAQGYTIQVPVPLAVRGERLCLSRRVATTPGGDESPLLAITELDDLGRWSKMTFFDHDALDSALDELDERYAAGEGVEHAYTIGRTSDLRHAVTAHDWAAVEALVADDFVFTDHRPIGLPGADRAGYLAAMTASAEQTPGTVMMGRALEIRGDVTLMRTRRVGATTEGFEYEWEQYAVNRWAAGLLRCVELFALEDESAARARFAESAAQSMTPYIDNAQIRFIVCEQWRGQYADGDPLAIPTEDCVLVDRRTSVNAGVITGGAEVSASIQSGIDVFGRLDLVPLATRGDRVGLYRWAFVQDGGFATPALTVITSAEDLRAARIESFDERDLADAVDLMEMRHAEIEGDSLTWNERIAAEGERTLNHRDFDGFGPLLAPGFTVVDHRRLGIPMDRDSYLESMRVLIEQAPDFTFFFAKLHIDGNVAITPVPFFGTTPEGNRYEWSYVQVAVGDPETGQALAFEFFDDDRWDDAVARFHELVAASRPATAPRDPRSPEPENRCTELLARAQTARRQGAPTDDFYAPDCRIDDRRHLVSAGATSGAEAAQEVIRAGVEVFGDLHVEPLAVRGERLMLGRWAFVQAGGFETGGITVIEIDASDRLAAVTTFDASDLLDAVDLLESRHAELAGDAYRAAERNWVTAIDAWRRGDWVSFADTMQSDFVRTDRSLLGNGVEDRTAYVTNMRQVTEMLPGFVPYATKYYASGRAGAAVLRLRTTDALGSEYEWRLIYVARVGTDGRSVELTTFDEEQWDDALALLDEWAEGPETGPPDNAAARTMVRWYGLSGRGDAGAADALTAEDIAMGDRRRGVSLPAIDGRRAFNEAMAATAAVFTDMETRTVAVRGDDHALLHVIRSRDGFELSTLVLVELAADGRMREVTIFDESDLDAALEELDALEAARQDAPPDGAAPSAELLDPMAEAFARRDWAWIRERTASDIELHDHRSTVRSPHAVGAGAVLDLLRGFAEVGFETVDNIHVASRGDRLVLLRRVYRSATGFELRMLAVFERDDRGLGTRISLFDDDALVPALDDLEIRYARSGRLTSNERQVMLGFVAVNHRAWKELDAVLAPDIGVVDHRRLGFPAGVGKEPLIHELQALVRQVPDVVVIIERLESAGRAVLARNRQVGASTAGVAVDWEWDLVFSVNGDGLLERMEYFDADDDGVARARARFEELARTDA